MGNFKILTRNYSSFSKTLLSKNLWNIPLFWSKLNSFIFEKVAQEAWIYFLCYGRPSCISSTKYCRAAGRMSTGSRCKHPSLQASCASLFCLLSSYCPLFLMKRPKCPLLIMLHLSKNTQVFGHNQDCRLIQASCGSSILLYSPLFNFWDTQNPLFSSFYFLPPKSPLFSSFLLLLLSKGPIFLLRRGNF